MSGLGCNNCGTENAAGSHFCRQCGLPLTGASPQWTGGTRYPAFRFQVDPMDPPPRRDVRYVMIVIGAALLIVGAMLFAVSAIIGGAIAIGSSCAAGACGADSPVLWFEWFSAPFLIAGAALLLLGLWRAFR